LLESAVWTGIPCHKAQKSAANKPSGCPFAAIIKATAPAVAPKVPEIVDDFYPRLFKNNPETKSFFNPANQFAEPPAQRLALANAIVAYATHIEDLGALKDAVSIIAHKHCALSVAPEHYPIVHKNLMESIGEVLGEVVTPEIAEGWSQAVLALAKVLIDTEQGLYNTAAERKGGWCGVKDFKVSGTRHVTEDCMELTFKAVEGDGPIEFTPGQFLTLHLKQEGATPRHYTITSAPGNDYLQCCVKKIPGGLVSTAAHSLKEGDIVGLTPPFGTFAMKASPSVLLSAGIGATPMKAFLASAPENVKLAVHIDKTAAAHPFKNEMDASGVKTKYFYTQESGRPSAEKLVEEVKPYLSECDFFLCGPRAFLNDMKAALEAAGAKSVNLDVFGPTLSL